MALKKQFKNNLFFQANISTHGRVQYIVKKNLTPSCLHNWSTGITGRYLALDITTAWGAHQQSTGKQVCSKLHLEK